MKLINFFKRYMVLLLVITMLMGVGGCSLFGQAKLDPKKPVTITIWHCYQYEQKTAFDSAVTEFNKTLGSEKGIVVKSVGHQGIDELATHVIKAAKGEVDEGNMPNMFLSFADTALQIKKMGLAVGIDAYLTKEELAEYEDAFLDEGKLGTDKLYILPIAKTTESLMLNKVDFDAFVAGLQSVGISDQVSYDDLSTWEGILRVADLYYRYTDALTPELNNDGKAFMSIDVLMNYILVASKQLGQDLVAVNDGKLTMSPNKEILSKIWNTYYEPMVSGRFIEMEEYGTENIKNGDSICFIGSISNASYFPEERQVGGETRSTEMLTLPMPVFENGEKVAISQGAGVVVTKSKKMNEQASAIFLNWFTEPEWNVPFALGTGNLPVKKKSLESDTFNKLFETTDQDDIVTQNLIKALTVGLEQLRNYTLYYSPVSDDEADLRDKLIGALEEAVRDDRLAYLALFHGGSTHEQACEKLLEQSKKECNDWIESLKK